jgi:hypothetical protein
MATETMKTPSFSAPAANTLTSLYIVPSSTQAIIPTINVCNTASAAATFRIGIRPGGAAIQAQNYLVYENSISGYESIIFNQGILLDAEDILSVYSSASTVSFTAFKMEVTA